MSVPWKQRPPSIMRGAILGNLWFAPVGVVAFIAIDAWVLVGLYATIGVIAVYTWEHG